MFVVARDVLGCVVCAGCGGGGGVIRRCVSVGSKTEWQEHKAMKSVRDTTEDMVVRRKARETNTPLTYHAAVKYLTTL